MVTALWSLTWGSSAGLRVGPCSNSGAAISGSVGVGHREGACYAPPNQTNAPPAFLQSCHELLTCRVHNRRGLCLLQYCSFGRSKILELHIVPDDAQALPTSRLICKRGTQKASASKVSMVKSYFKVKIGVFADLGLKQNCQTKLPRRRWDCSWLSVAHLYGMDKF